MRGLWRRGDNHGGVEGPPLSCGLSCGAPSPSKRHCPRIPARTAEPKQRDSSRQSQEPYISGAPLNDARFSSLRRRALYLNPANGIPKSATSGTLSVSRSSCRGRRRNQLASWAEQLTAETCAAELEILHKPHLLAELGLPHSIRNILRQSAPLTPAAARVMRFDFHYTTQGWRISEVNSDVPGGFAEASDFCCYWLHISLGHNRPAGPATHFGPVRSARAASGSTVALLATPGYMEDQQIAFGLSDAPTRCARVHRSVAWQVPAQLHVEKRNRPPHHGPAQRQELAAVVRFYQGEWLARLPQQLGWSHFFREGRTPITNPGHALISESKRFPLLWDRLQTALPMWRTLLPEFATRVRCHGCEPAIGCSRPRSRTTATPSCIRERMSPHAWQRTTWSALLFPAQLGGTKTLCTPAARHAGWTCIPFPHWRFIRLMAAPQAGKPGYWCLVT